MLCQKEYHVFKELQVKLCTFKRFSWNLEERLIDMGDSGDKNQKQRLQLTDNADLSEAVFAESYESAHSDQDFTSRLAHKLGVTKPPYRIDSQAKYGKTTQVFILHAKASMSFHGDMLSTHSWYWAQIARAFHL